MAILVGQGSRQAGRRGVGAVAESSHLETVTKQRGLTGNRESFETSKLTLSDTPPSRPHFLIIPKQFHQLRAKCSHM